MNIYFTKLLFRRFFVSSKYSFLQKASSNTNCELLTSVALNMEKISVYCILNIHDSIGLSFCVQNWKIICPCLDDFRKSDHNVKQFVSYAQ